MSFTNNDTFKKLKNIIPKHINNQTVPIDILIVIDEYIPKLHDKNIRQAVIDYIYPRVKINNK